MRWGYDESAGRRHLPNVPFYPPGCMGGEFASFHLQEFLGTSSPKTDVGCSFPHWHCAGQNSPLECGVKGSYSRYPHPYLSPRHHGIVSVTQPDRWPCFLSSSRIRVIRVRLVPSIRRSRERRMNRARTIWVRSARPYCLRVWVLLRWVGRKQCIPTDECLRHALVRLAYR